MATLNLKEMKWIDENALRIIISTGLGFASRVQALENKEIEEFTADKLYEKGSKVLHNNYLWIAKVTNQSSTFNENYWTLVGDDITELDLDEIKGFLGLTQEQLNTLASIILDNEIRLDKTWSSSKTYSDIQDAIKECKQYCITELAKKSTGSFKKANSTSEVTDGNYLYLILNSSTNKYDIYALVDSNVELLTSVDVNLDDYYTKAEINNDFLKKTDATSTYATKTELVDKADATALDDKVDKTDIVNNLTSTDTNKPLSANQGKALDDKKLNKTDITTTIDSSSTDSQVPSAKAVHAELDKKANATDLTTHTSDTNIHITSEERTLWNDGVRRIVFVGSNELNTNGWYKVAEQTCSGYGDTNITFMVTSTFKMYHSGILQLQIRSDVDNIKCDCFKWLSRIGFPISNFIIVINGMTWTLYAYQPSIIHGRIAFEILSMSSIEEKDMTWTLNFKDNNTKETTIPVATVTSSDIASNVPLTTLTNSSDINSDAVITYMVKNGVCYVSINTLSSTKMSTGNITLTTGIPIPINPSCWYSLCTNSNATNAPLQNLLLRIDSSGNLIAYKGTDNINYFGSFSYPVKES